MLYITSLCSSKRRISDAISELVNLGFRDIELTGRTEFYENIEDDLLNLKDKHKINFLVHNYFPPPSEAFVINLASTNSDIRDKTLRLIKQAVSLSEKVGNKLYSIHPGFSNDLQPTLKDGFFIKNSERPNNREDFYKTINIVVDNIIDRDFKIAVENLCPKISGELYSFISSPDDIGQFLNYYHDKPNVGILLDMGHLNVASDYHGFDKKEVLSYLFSKCKDRLFEIHISENNGDRDSHDVSPLDSWQVKVLCENRKMLKDIPVVLEWHDAAMPSTFERFLGIKKKLD